MSLPKQPLNIDVERQALAPYNFVELPERIAAVLEGDTLGKAATEAERNELVTVQLPDQNTFHAARHSGWIDCLLTTESPAYVRAPRTEEEARRGIQSKDLPAFFYEWEQDEPVIPGSTLRGMLRALVEIAGFGKVTEVHSRPLVYRAIGKETEHERKYRDLLMRDDTKLFAKGKKTEHYYTPWILGGYMTRVGSDWFIQPAEERNGTTFARIRIDEGLFNRCKRIPKCLNASEIYVEIGSYDYQPVKGGFLNVRAARVIDSDVSPASNLFKAALVRSGKMFSKKSEAVIFPPDKLRDRLPLNDDQTESYRKQLSEEQKLLLGKGGVLQEGQPVFYLLQRDELGQPKLDKQGRPLVEFFGHCRMLRVPYRQTPRDFVPPQLRDVRDVDLAEAIFGFTKDPKDFDHPPDKKELRYAGRVKVSSARLLENQQGIWLSTSPFILRVLGMPKPTTFQHYLVQTKPNRIETGQYDRNNYPKTELKLADYNVETPERSVIRGHKLYWHKSKLTQSDLELTEGIKEKVTTNIRPVNAGVIFKFKVQFDNLSSGELGALLWVLRLGAEEKHRLKLGMGKPFGMGAVKVTPTLHLIDRVQRYSQLFDGERWANGEQPTIAKTESTAIKSFMDFVLSHSVQPQVAEFEGLMRIQQLRAMLEWPGPEPARTRYLEIPNERNGKRNEYRERPVLPSPLAVNQKIGQAASGLGTQKSTPGLTERTKAPTVASLEMLLEKTNAKSSNSAAEFSGKKKELVTLISEITNGSAEVKVGYGETLIVCRKFPYSVGVMVNRKCRAEISYDKGKIVSASFLKWE